MNVILIFLLSMLFLLLLSCICICSGANRRINVEQEDHINLHEVRII